MKYYENGIENLKGTFEEVKELFNKNVEPIEIINDPEQAQMVKLLFDFAENYIQIQSENRKILERIDEKMEEIESVKKEVSYLRTEIERLKSKESELK